MKILITNDRLDGPGGGARSFVRDLGHSLEKLGHTVLAYSSHPGGQDRPAEGDMVTATGDLEKLPFLPDVIHAQHHLDAMTAITGLPGVPALYHCHGGVWRDCVPKHPRIHHYLAMSRTLKERIVVESNIAPSDVTVFLNGIDLARFCKVRTPSPRPARALVYQRAHGNDFDTVAAIREAAARTGIELDFIGQRFGRTISDPEEVLPAYDIVFTSGISAIEALACGCMVVVLGRTSCGEMVTAENFSRLRQVNFSIAVNSPPPSADRIEAELRRYSPEQAAQVTTRLRSEADLSIPVEQVVRAYEAVIEKQRHIKHDVRSEMLATSRYLRSLTALIKVMDGTFENGPVE